MATRYQRVEVRGPFEATERDARRARAILETEDRTYRISVVIPGPSDAGAGMLDEDTRQLVLGYLTLAGLERLRPEDLDRLDGTATGWPEVVLPLLAEPPPQGWSGVAVESYAQHELMSYVVTREGDTWQARAMDASAKAHHARMKRGAAEVLAYLQEQFHGYAIEAPERSDRDTGSDVRTFWVRKGEERSLLRVSDEVLDMDAEGVRRHLQLLSIALPLRRMKRGEALMVTTDGTRVEPIL